MKKFRTIIMLTVMCSMLVTPVWRTQATVNYTTSTSRVSVNKTKQDIPPAVRQIINNIFQAFNNVVVPFANKINEWKNDAVAAANKTVSDFTSCPSPAAQALYNDLQVKRANLTQTINMADQQDNAAQTARNNCRNQVPQQFRSACDVAYNGLPFAGIEASARAARTSVDAALASLRNLRCISGCSQSASFLFPTVSVQPTTTRVPVPNADVCTQWNPGSFRFDNNSSGNTLSATAEAQLPSCARTERISACNWEISVLLPVLQELRLVPPEVRAPDIRIEIPDRNLRIISRLTQSCSQPLRVCTQTQTNANVTLDLTGNPLTNLQNLMNGVSTSCTQWETVGCLNPAFGLTPTYQTIQVPDLTRARIIWSGGRLLPGSVVVDLTQRRFSVACRAESLTLPGIPRLNIGSQRVNVPFICLQPQTRGVVANP